MTFDLDFCNPYFINMKLRSIILRISNQTPISVNNALQRLDKAIDRMDVLPGTLFIVDDATIRIRTSHS